MINTDKIYKKLFVIHNLESFVEREQVESYIDEYLKNSATFELKENNYTNNYFYSPKNYIHSSILRIFDIL